MNLGGLAMKNPVTTASGTFAAGMEYADFVDVAGLGAVTTKGVSLNGWEGNASPRIAETPSGMLNSIGLQNPGVAHLKEIELPWLAEQGATVIVNVSGHSFNEYVQVIEALEREGKIRELDLFILDRTLAQMDRWREKGYRLFPVSVNFSRLTLFDPTVVASVLAIQSRYPALPEDILEIEITENAGNAGRPR